MNIISVLGADRLFVHVTTFTHSLDSILLVPAILDLYLHSIICEECRMA